MLNSQEIPYNGFYVGDISDPVMHLFSGTVTLGASKIDLSPPATNYNVYLFGFLDEVAIWDGALSDAEIRATFEAKPMGTESNLFGYWISDEVTARDDHSSP